MTATEHPRSTGKYGIPHLTGAEIRQGFIDFFAAKGHAFVPSSGVFPKDDPTLLFTNAGMNQFKAALLGDNKEGYTRVANSQKCIRVSGKHNDLDEVGRDTYHHTFFEMLGNWSFGDYYKSEAIAWAWELLTEVWKLPKDRLFATVYQDDDEAIALWAKHTDIDPDRVLRFGAKENFWEMGDVGPCGPCTEIHFDLGDEGTRAATFRDKQKGVNGTDGRYIEIWNLVFMQSERLSDGSLKPLKRQNVDTGMGFERIASIIQGSGSNYETDLFQPIIQSIAAKTGTPYQAGPEGTPHRVIADHLRALSFAVADGATPGNEGRGYVLRRILRRASRFARNLGCKEPLLHTLVPDLSAVMGDAFPELPARQAYVQEVLRSEEERFSRTLDQGLERFAKVAREAKASGAKQVGGADAFTLYDTYGFPLDLTRQLAEEQGLGLDEAGYEKEMEIQRERARGAAKFDSSFQGDEGWTLLADGTETRFVGYESLAAPMPVLRYREQGDDILLVARETPFYPESGGQVGDSGRIEGADGLVLRVDDTFKVNDMIVHRCRLLEGLLKPASLGRATGRVDESARSATFRNHSATHLLHAALRGVLGDHVQQQGSRVAPEGLRFDFTHHQAVTAAELAEIEARVNRSILADLPVTQETHGIEEAKQLGAMALFGEKYGDRVRVIRMGEVSLELCGGTHARATGQIGFLKILSEGSVAAGVRRIEAVTGEGALAWSHRQAQSLEAVGQALKAKPGQEIQRAQEAMDKLKSLEKEVASLRAEQARAQVKTWLEKSAPYGDARVLLLSLSKEGLSREQMPAAVDALAELQREGLAVLTHADADSLSIAAVVGPETRKKIKAGDLVKKLAEVAGGKGGGRPDRAQAGSKDPGKEAAVLAEAEKLARGIFGD